MVEILRNDTHMTQTPVVFRQYMMFQCEPLPNFREKQRAGSVRGYVMYANTKYTYDFPN